MDAVLTGTAIYDRSIAQVEITYRAVRNSIRSPETGLFGSYRKALKTGIIAAGLAGPQSIWEFRWGTPGIMAIVRRVKVQSVVSTTAFTTIAAGVNQGLDNNFLLYKAQGFTVLDSTNGTLAGFTKNKAGANATRMAPSALAGGSTYGGIVILNTNVAGLTGGTKTLDDDPIHTVANRQANTAAAETIITPEPPPLMIDPTEMGKSPIELNVSEGLVLQIDQIPGTGTWRVAVEVDWDEVDPARYF